jgi:hypothetical protein
MWDLKTNNFLESLGKEGRKEREREKKERQKRRGEEERRKENPNNFYTNDS